MRLCYHLNCAALLPLPPPILSDDELLTAAATDATTAHCSCAANPAFEEPSDAELFSKLVFPRTDGACPPITRNPVSESQP